MATRSLHQHTATTDLRDAVEFAQMDLSKASAKKLETCELFVQRIIHRGELGRYVKPGEIDRRTLITLQESALEILESITTPRESHIAVSGDLKLSFSAVEDADGVLRIVTLGSVMDRFQYHLIRLIVESGIEKLRACPAHRPRPETGTCGRIFLKVTNKDHCSTRCQSRAYMAKMRDDHRKQQMAILERRTRDKKTWTW
jgi:hypothetical protein